jgi:hypothetical protein
MALSEKDTADIIALHAGGGGESVPALARAYGVSVTTIRNHLKKSLPVDPSNTASDEDLGIGEEDAGSAGDALAALMANPALAALIDQAVSARLAQMAAPQPAAPITGEAFGNLAEALKRMIENQQMQQAGYIKPLPLEEVERRASGKVEMDALLRKYEADGTPPLYAVGELGFFECTNAIELTEGQQLRTYLYPCEDFEPRNEEARKVHAAMMQWIGGPSPEIGERVKQAHLDAKQAPLIGSEPAPLVDPRRGGGLIEVVDAAPEAAERKSARRRGMGTIVQEPVDVSLTGRAPGAAQTLGGPPAGPF